MPPLTYRGNAIRFVNPEPINTKLGGMGVKIEFLSVPTCYFFRS